MYNVAGGGNYSLNGSIGSTDTTLTLSSFTEPVSGVAYTMALLNTSIAYATIAPKTSSSEFVSFTGITQNADGTATITGLTRGLAKKYPFTTSANFQLPHSGQAVFILSDAPQVFNQFASLGNDETFTGLITFSQAPIGINPGGQPDSSTTVKGVGKVSVAPVSSTSPIFIGQNDPVVPTQGENDALVGNNTSIAVGTGNKFVTQTGFQNRAETYATSSGSANAYVLTLSPVPTAYAAGQEFEFKANFSNTTTATLNVNSLGAKTINKLDGATALVLGDIISGQVVKVKYDGTNFQMISPIGTAAPSLGLFKNGTTTHTMNSSTTQVIPHGLGVAPKYIKITAIPENGAANNFAYQSIGVYNGTTTSTVFMTQLSATSKNGGGVDATNIIALWTDTALGTGITAVGTFDATNITLTYTLTGGGYSNQLAGILWEAQA